MMKKSLKVLSGSLLLTTLFLSGCSCSNDDEVVNVSKIDNGENTILNNLSNDTSKYNLNDVYNALIAGDAGNKKIADKLVDYVATKVLDLSNNESKWKTRYDALVAEELEKVADVEDYEVDGEFSEAFFIQYLKSEGYSVTCPSNVEYGSADDLACDYTDYVNKQVKVGVVSKLLKEKYIEEKTLSDRPNTLTNKKIRDVEYFSLSSSLESNYTDLNVRDFMRELRDRIADKEVIDFEAINEEFKAKLQDIVDTEYAKIGTSDDYNQSIAAKYTSNFTQDKKVGYDSKVEEVENLNYAGDLMISSDSDSSAVISSTITSTLLSITNPTDSSFARKVVSVTDTSGATYYYLVSINAGVNVDAEDVLISETGDSSTYTYSIVRFKVVNSDTTDANLKKEAIELLASSSTLANNALSHYLKENKDTISVYDDSVYEYLKTLYPDVFAD